MSSFNIFDQVSSGSKIEQARANGRLAQTGALHAVQEPAREVSTLPDTGSLFKAYVRSSFGRYHERNNYKLKFDELKERIGNDLAKKNEAAYILIKDRNFPSGVVFEALEMDGIVEA